MPWYRVPQLLLWACTAAALQAPAPPRTSLLTAKAATEGAEIPYELCCQALHDDEAARLAAGPDDILKARYSAYVERKPDFIIDTTHPTNEEYDEDRDAWRARILDFAAAAKFLQLVIYDSVPIDEETHSITWNARIKVLDGLVDERLVETCVEINHCVGCTRRFFTKSFLGDDVAALAPSSGEEPAAPRRRAGAASMAWRTTRRFRNAP